MAPRQRGLTLMPVLPSVRIFMSPPYAETGPTPHPGSATVVPEMESTPPAGRTVNSGRRPGRDLVALEELPHGLVGVDEHDAPPHAVEDPGARGPGVEECCPATRDRTR